jgi:hypothetical protein
MTQPFVTLAVAGGQKVVEALRIEGGVVAPRAAADRHAAALRERDRRVLRDRRVGEQARSHRPLRPRRRIRLPPAQITPSWNTTSSTASVLHEQA